jgi:hypothetical protein
MPRGASPKREREYRALTHEFKESGRYPGREEEVASRIVNKQRAQFGETKAEEEKDRRGQSPDRNLPIPNYQHLTVDEVKGRLESLDKQELEQIRRYEETHNHRKTLLEELDGHSR